MTSENKKIRNKPKNRSKNLFIFISLLISVINAGLFWVVLLFTFSKSPEQSWLGIDGLREAVYVAAAGVYAVFSFIIVVSVAATWLDARRSNLIQAIMGMVDKGKGAGSEYYDPEAIDTDKFRQVDDEKLIMRSLVPYDGLIIPVLLFLIPLSVFLYHVWEDEVTGIDGIWLCLTFLIFCTLVYNLCFRIRYVEFNRMKGTVTVPSFLFPWYRTFRFEKVQLNAYEGKFRLAIPYRLALINLPGDGENAQKWWSFYVWYMDKNRPLPPGSLLDEYREKDFLRRQQEGFPPALYPSVISMKDVDGNTKRYEVCDLKELIDPELPNDSTTTVVAYGNTKMDALNIGHQPLLTHLFCSGMELYALDVSQCPKLTDLECRDNELTMLDISHNPLLERFDCSNNPLEQLKVWPGFDPEKLEHCNIPAEVEIITYLQL